MKKETTITFQTNEILKRINESSKNGKKTFSGMYNLLTREDFIYQIVTQIKKNKGIDTKGTDNKGFDGFGTEDIKELKTRLKEGTYDFNPVKRVYIPKPGKEKKRPLGIPTLTDKIVQGMVNGILTAIYEPVFEKERENANYGFRRKKGVRDAIEKIERLGKNTRWCLEGGIEGAYDNVDHGKLLNIIRERIEDKKLLELIKKMLKSGVMYRKKRIETEIGTPQGGIISPMLFNIYMDSLDKYVQKEIEEERKKEKTEGKVDNRQNRDAEYTRVTGAIRKEVDKIKKIENQKGKDRTKWEERERTREKISLEKIKELGTKRGKMRSRSVKNTWHRTVYLRYADDWILMTNGKKERTRKWKEKIRQFLWNELGLRLSEDKTKETDLRKEPAKFLGFSLMYPKNQKEIRDKYGRKRRTTGQQLTVDIDKVRVLNKLAWKGHYDKKEKQGIAKNSWTVRSDYEIIENFNWLKRGAIGYFGQGIRTFYRMGHIRWILETSCKKTIAKKHDISTSRVMEKHGRYAYAEIDTDKGKKRISEMSYEQEKELFDKIRKNRTLKTEEYSVEGKINWRTAMKLKSGCVICGSEERVEMHHLKQIRNIKAKGFAKIMVGLNRKQISVCRECHIRIHKGDYNEKKLSKFHDAELATL